MARRVIVSVTSAKAVIGFAIQEPQTMPHPLFVLIHHKRKKTAEEADSAPGGPATVTKLPLELNHRQQEVTV